MKKLICFLSLFFAAHSYSLTPLEWGPRLGVNFSRADLERGSIKFNEEFKSGYAAGLAVGFDLKWIELEADLLWTRRSYENRGKDAGVTTQLDFSLDSIEIPVLGYVVFGDFFKFRVGGGLNFVYGIGKVRRDLTVGGVGSGKKRVSYSTADIHKSGVDAVIALGPVLDLSIVGELTLDLRFLIGLAERGSGQDFKPHSVDLLAGWNF